jgi:hypothetical protein
MLPPPPPLRIAIIITIIITPKKFQFENARRSEHLGAYAWVGGSY